jgi:DNA-binding LytR/AlgR family response regulator
MVVKGRTNSLGLGLYAIKPEDITYVEQNREYFAVHFIGAAEPVRIHGTTREADELFPFLVRIQRTYLINLHQVASVHSRIKRQVDVTFRNGTRVDFIKSDIHHDKFIQAFEKI